MSRVAEAQQELKDKAARNAQLYGDGSMRLVWEVRALWRLVEEQEQDLAQEQAANAANTATIQWLKAVIEQWHNTGDVRGPLPELVEEYFIGAQEGATGP